VILKSVIGVRFVGYDVGEFAVVNWSIQLPVYQSKPIVGLFPCVASEEE